MKLQNKTVFITDPDHQTGKAIMNRLADEGANFILNSASNGSKLQDDLERCQALGSKILVININLCKSTEVCNALEKAEQEIGTVDVFIHNNNLVKPTSVEYCDEALFLEIMDTNTKSAFICTQAIGKQMSAKQSGKIIYVSSIHAEKPTGASFVYSVSKGAVKNLAREVSLVLGREGVQVNSIEMGPVEGDDLIFKNDLSTLYNDYQYKVPNTILGTHHDLANLVYFLTTDEAKFINGEDIRLDGGFLLHYGIMKKSN